MSKENNLKKSVSSDSGYFPDNIEIWEWWNKQNFQKEEGEQEYTMIYEIDLPKILKEFTDYFGICCKQNKNTQENKTK